MLLVGKFDVDDLVTSDADQVLYNVVPENDQWWVNVVKEITEVKFGDLQVEGFTWNELQEILSEVSTN